MADINIGSNELLTKELATTDRITLTKAETGQTIATMTVEDFMKHCATLMPTASEAQRGIMTPEMLRAACHKLVAVDPGATATIGHISGLMSFQNNLRWKGHTTLLMVDTADKSVTHVAGWEHPKAWGTFSFDAGGNLCFTNKLTYQTSLTIAYQNLEL